MSKKKINVMIEDNDGTMRDDSMAFSDATRKALQAGPVGTFKIGAPVKDARFRKTILRKDDQ